MAVLDRRDRRAARAIAALTTANPFDETRVALERRALGKAYVGPAVAWSFDPTARAERPNVAALDRRAEAIVARMKSALEGGEAPNDEERRIYDDLVLYLVFSRFEDSFFRAITEGAPIDFFEAFERDLAAHRAAPSIAPLDRSEAAHLFALFFQLRRAFQFTYRRILGASRPAARLRAAVWQSIFTHDLDRYRRILFDRMQDVPTLVTGPSGTGKELVASAIGWSRYLPYDARKGTFGAEFRETFVPLNLSALSFSLIESELFGHRRGAFTGAVADREGYLAQPSPYATVFLDEIGDVDASIQVKLLRVIQTRTFARLGDGVEQRFEGKIVAATHRDLALAMKRGDFREDFYYRLCADRIETPSLAAQIADDDDELERIVLAVAHRVTDPLVAETLAADTIRVIEDELGRDYPWPGNMRELEQCLRSVLVRRTYRPAVGAAPDPAVRMFEELPAGKWSADEVLQRYCTLVYVQSGSYEEAARRLLLDRRTVKRRVDPQWVERLGAPKEDSS